MTRAKGKQTMLTEAERQEQYNKLREEELRCKAMQEKLRAQRLQLEQLQAPPKPPQREAVVANPRQQEPSKNLGAVAHSNCNGQFTLAPRNIPRI